MRTSRQLLVGLVVIAVATYGVGALVMRWAGASWPFGAVLSILLCLSSTLTSWFASETDELSLGDTPDMPLSVRSFTA